MSLNAIEYELVKTRKGIVLTAKLSRMPEEGEEIRLASAIAPNESVIDLLKRFIDENYFAVAGGLVKFTDFIVAWRKWLPKTAPKDAIGKQTIITCLRALGYTYGRHGANQMYIGNLSAHQQAPGSPYADIGGKLVLQ